MAFVRLGNAFVPLLLISLLLCSSIAVYADEVEPDLKPPPIKPPVKPPPSPPPTKRVAVEGVVYCKSCKYRETDKLLDAAPLHGAVVKLQCKDEKFSLVKQTETDKEGYFFFKPEKLTTAIADKCKVFLVSSPLYKCSVPTNINGGVAGAILEHSAVTTTEKEKPLVLYTVGPFAFEPLKKLCYHY